MTLNLNCWHWQKGAAVEAARVNFDRGRTRRNLIRGGGHGRAQFFSDGSSTYCQETFGDLRTLLSLGRACCTAHVLRTMDRLVRSVSVSGIPHAVMFPGKFRREAASVGLTGKDLFADGYYPLSFNHRLWPAEKTPVKRFDKIGGAVLPGLGNNYYPCVEKL